jgi:hypothetical protein
MKTPAKNMTDKEYRLVPMPADLRDELKLQAHQDKRPLCDVASDYVRGIIASDWQPEGDLATVYIATRLESDELDAVKALASKANMTLSTFIREYQKQFQYEKAQ